MAAIAGEPMAQAAGPEADRVRALKASIRGVFVGNADAVDLVLVSLLAGGHLLIEDVPGVGKTTLAKALARSIACTFRRIQFTPDLLPSDVTGVSIYEQKEGRFVFKPGPVFANVVLADEINRTNPRTQSALLEAMNDHQVTVDGESHPLPAPFIVLATQNPYEFEGTYPLPESQLDRFLMRIQIGYPNAQEEKQVLASRTISDPLEAIRHVATGDEVSTMQAAVREVRVDDAILDYIIELVTATRESERLHVGVSPRGSLALRRAAQALALVLGRGFVVPDDVKRLAVPVLAHRVIPKGRHLGLPGAGGGEAVEAIREIVAAVAVPA